MNGGRHREPITAEGCVSAIGWFIGAFFALSLTGVSVAWFFSAPDVCAEFGTVQVIEETKDQQPILVDMQVCRKYVKSPVPSPFWRTWEWITR